MSLWCEDSLCLCVKVKSLLCREWWVCLFACFKVSLCAAGRGSLHSGFIQSLSVIELRECVCECACFSESTGSCVHIKCLLVSVVVTVV